MRPASLRAGPASTNGPRRFHGPVRLRYPRPRLRHRRHPPSAAAPRRRAAVGGALLASEDAAGADRPHRAAAGGAPSSATASNATASGATQNQHNQNNNGNNKHHQHDNNHNNKGGGGGGGNPGPCTPTGQACQQNSDCCGGNCFGQLCAPRSPTCPLNRETETCSPAGTGCCAEDGCCQPPANQCNDGGRCVVPPNCAGRECGDDGCGNDGNLRQLLPGQTCDEESGQCQGQATCSPETCPDGCCDAATGTANRGIPSKPAARAGRRA